MNFILTRSLWCEIFTTSFSVEPLHERGKMFYLTSHRMWNRNDPVLMNPWMSLFTWRFFPFVYSWNNIHNIQTGSRDQRREEMNWFQEGQARLNASSAHFDWVHLNVHWKQCVNINITFHLLSKDSPLVICQSDFYLFQTFFLFHFFSCFHLPPHFPYLFSYSFCLSFFSFFFFSTLAEALIRIQKEKFPPVENKQTPVGNVTANMRCPKAYVGSFRLPNDIPLILNSAWWTLGKLFMQIYFVKIWNW